MLFRSRLFTCGTLALAALPLMAAPEVVLPGGRNAFHTTEPIELAVTELTAGQAAKLEIVPQGERKGIAPIQLDYQGEGTATAVLPALALAPGDYELRLNGTKAGTLKLVHGVWRSPMLLTPTEVARPGGGVNFQLANMFRFGLTDAEGLPLQKVRGVHSPGVAGMQGWVASGVPVLVYMYWTGFVTHKPWGSEKSWANPEMQSAMRLFNFANGQRARNHAPAIAAIGPIDEPGLAWGQTPAGGMASGFPNPDEKSWYEARGWKYTQDIAAQPDDEWHKYVKLRAEILRESYAQASRDIKTVWPGAVFEGDLYAPHVPMDGTSAMNQRANDAPTTHVFFDFFGGPMSVPGQIYAEKAHDPTAHVAHAMNGQLTGARGPQKPLYHQLMNAMLQAGLKSNWWLNTGSMQPADLAEVNEPAERWGAMFRNIAPRHEVALLWGFTEPSLRQKKMAALESSKKTGEQIKLMVPLPEAGELSEAEMASNSYEVGGVYANQIIGTHQALRRAGYPAHIIHEDTLPEGMLKNYRVLVVAGQTVPFPPAVRRALDEFTARGGKIVADRSSAAQLPGAIVHEAKLSETDLRGWDALLAEKTRKAANAREASLYGAMTKIIEPYIAAVAPIKAAMARSGVAPAVITDARDLSIERHSAGEGSVIMVLNGHEQLPETAETAAYPRYNLAPYSATFTLNGVPRGAAVYKVEGLDWKTITRVTDATAPQTENFAAGEMKLYLVMPRAPRGLVTTARQDGGALLINTRLDSGKLALPLNIEVRDPAGAPLFNLLGATAADGTYSATLPLGTNAPAGTYTVAVSSPVAALQSGAKLNFVPRAAAPAFAAGAVRVLDEQPMRALLRGKQPVVVAYSEAQRGMAEQLAKDLAARGVQASAMPEAQALRKALYPRIWDPFVTVRKAEAQDQALPADAKVERTIAITQDEAKGFSATGSDGKDYSGDVRVPNSLLTVGPGGWIDWMNQDVETIYEPGTKVFVDAKRQLTVINGAASRVETTPEFRAKWARPWQRLTSYNGGYQLPPQLPEAYAADHQLIVLGDSSSSFIARVLQASEVLPQVVDEKVPGPRKALLQYAWSPFGVEKNVIFVGASDAAGLEAGTRRLLELAQ